MRTSKIALIGGAALVVVAIAYIASPYISVARFARHLDARNTPAVASRIDFPAVRQSIARQAARAFLAKNPDVARKSPLGASAGAMIVGGFINAYLAETFTPQALEAILAETRAPPQLGAEPLTVPSLSKMQDGLALWRQSGFTDLTAFTVRAPENPDGSMSFGFNLQGTVWRLTSLSLPQRWLDRLVEDIGRKLPKPE